MSVIPNELPPGWCITDLGSLGDYLNGRGFKKSEWGTEGRPIIRIQNLTGSSEQLNYFNGTVDLRHEVKAGDLLMSWAATLGAYIWRGPNAVLNQHIFKVESFIDSQFHYYALKWTLDVLHRNAHGTGMVHVTKGKFEETSIPLPPLPEQQRIVDTIESYLTRLDDAAATLERVQRNLKRYRASVLKAAVEGRLVPTEAELARAAGRDYEPASVLLERVLVEKKPTSSRTTTNDDRKPANKGHARTLPEGWVWTTLGEITLRIDSGTATTAINQPTSRRVIRSSAVRQRSIDFRDHRFLPDDALPSETRFVAEGDLLFTRLSGTLAYVGNCAVVPALGDQRFEFPDRIFRARVDKELSADYISLCFGVAHLRDELERVAKSSAGHQRISLSDLRGFKIPLPPAAEQIRIAAEVDRLLTTSDAVHRDTGVNIGICDRLRQSILKWAFEGRLVDQDPSDEPASVLLQRIKAERAESAGTAKSREPRRKGNSTNA